MDLHFDWLAILKALEEIRTATTAQPLAGKPTAKGLWCVFQNGIYLAPNTTDGIHHRNGQPRIEVYALECNPRTMPFSEWSAVKHEIFGPLDGIEFIKTTDLCELAEAIAEPAFAPNHLAMRFEQGHYEMKLKFPSRH